MHHEHTVQVEPQGSLLLSVPCFALGQAVSKPDACASLPPWGRSDNHRLLRRDKITPRMLQGGRKTLDTHP